LSSGSIGAASFSLGAERAVIHRASFIAAAGASRTGRSFTLIGAARGTSDVQVRGTIVTCPSANSIHTASGPNLRNTSTGSPHRGWIVRVSCTADGVDAEEEHVAEGVEVHAAAVC
jgi:hypothetical protein